MTNNRRSEMVAVLFLSLAMFAACYGFAHSFNPHYLDQLSQAVNASLSFTGFSFAAFVGACFVWFLMLFDFSLLRPGTAALVKQVLYVVCGSPTLAYSVPAGIIIIEQGELNQIAGVIYITLFVSFVVIAYLAFKPRASHDDVPTET